MKHIEIYTDGACRGNPGPGGWGALLRSEGKDLQIKGSESHTTNNRMELTAAIKALTRVKKASTVDITTDSTYVRDGITKWLSGWKRKGWITASKKPVKNQDLWQLLDTQVQRHDVNWHWVKAHNGHTENELVDQLANQAIDEMLEKK